MLTDIRHILKTIIAAVSVAVAMTSCSGPALDFDWYSGQDTPRDEQTRMPNREFRNVFIIFSMGFNNLTNYLKEDIEDLIASPLMSNQRDVLLIFSHNAKWYPGDGIPRYSEAVSPTLTQVSKDFEGNVIRDTLLVMSSDNRSSDSKTLGKVLTFIKENYHADSYGMLMSSHGTGWVPADYCNNPSKYEALSGGALLTQRADNEGSIYIPKPYLGDLSVNGLPAVKSIGVQNSDRYAVTEMNITDLADAIPMKMDFIIFDACFMGGVEVAYELKDVCDKVVFSQTEILADGMDYDSMSSYIYTGRGADLAGFCENYYQYYNSQSGSSKSATISLVDCTALETLADVCREIFQTRRTGLRTLEFTPSLQKYYRVSDHRWFFDLYDVAQKAGASEDQLLALDVALKDCVLYKASTEIFLGLSINVHSGLSMYIPYSSRTYLNDFYKTLEWNKATGLVQ